MATTDDELRQRAEAATPGPWLVERDYPSPDVHDAKGNVIATTMHSDLSRQEDGANAAFIAAASPETVKRLLDRVAKAEAGWQPIETAPRDPWVLVYAAPAHGLDGFICTARYHSDGGWCVDELRHATHWRPLPAAPEPTP